jgi:hypothetical protein
MAFILGENSEQSQQSCGENAPDLHLIKQVEQVTTSASEASPACRTGYPPCPARQYPEFPLDRFEL